MELEDQKSKGGGVVGWWVGGRETRREFVVGGMVKDSKGQAFELKICSKQLTPKVS